MKRRLKKSHYNSRVSLHEALTKKKSHYNSRVSLHDAPTKNHVYLERPAKMSPSKWQHTIFENTVLNISAEVEVLFEFKFLRR